MCIIERTIGEIIKLAQELPDFNIIKSIPGIGDNLAARIIAELGDMTRFVLNHFRYSINILFLKHFWMWIFFNDS